MDKLRQVLNNDDLFAFDEESNILTEISEAAGLSKTTRFKGFIILFSFGVVFSFISFFIILLGIRLFVTFYTLGNICYIASTFFLMGPIKQIKRMFAPTRFIATLLVIIMFCLTIFAVFVIHSTVLAIIAAVLQSLAITWYIFSYIPYMRGLIKNSVTSCCGI